MGDSGYADINMLKFKQSRSSWRHRKAIDVHEELI
jgi:hypothetical protein